MYDYIDRPIAQLDPHGRLMISAMRQWVRARELGRCGCNAINAVFTQGGVVEALPEFHMMMAVLNGDGVRRFVLGCICDPLVIDDEAVLLALVHAAASGQVAIVEESAARMVAPHMTRVFARSLIRLADGLAALSPADQHKGTSS